MSGDGYLSSESTCSNNYTVRKQKSLCICTVLLYTRAEISLVMRMDISIIRRDGAENRYPMKEIHRESVRGKIALYSELEL